MKIADRAREISPFHVMEILARAKAMERDGKSILHLEIGEPDFPTPPLVVEAALEFIRGGDVKYTPAAGLPELREAIAGYYARHYGIRVAAERIVVTPGASGGLLLALGLVLGAGEKVGLADPGYPCYGNFVRVFGGVPNPVPVDESTGFHLTAELLQNYWDERMAGIVVASPANPTGSVTSPACLAGVLEFVRERGGFVISDEIYHGLEYGPRAASALEFCPRAFVVNSFSKYFGMTGWRLGWVVVPDDFIAPAERLAQNIFISAPTHSQVAALAAFVEDNLAELGRRRLEFQARRDLLYAGLSELGFAVTARPDGAFYIFADCRRFAEDSALFAQDLLTETGVAVTPGLDFGTHHPERYLRFCYTLGRDRLAEALARIGDFVHRPRRGLRPERRSMLD
jgi:aspartate/methionine/tyrosine aminotransferase